MMVWAKCLLRRFSAGLFISRITTWGASFAVVILRLGKGGAMAIGEDMAVVDLLLEMLELVALGPSLVY